jgi:hypothetical protein
MLAPSNVAGNRNLKKKAPAWLSDSIVSSSIRAHNKVEANKIACFRSSVIEVSWVGVQRNGRTVYFVLANNVVIGWGRRWVR